MFGSCRADAFDALGTLMVVEVVGGSVGLLGSTTRPET
jgi:hypothetical protein